MIRRLLGLAVLFSALTVLPAAAAHDEGMKSTPRAPVEHIQLAQNGDIQVFYDSDGRRVLLDTYTGEVVSIEEPRRRQIERRYEEPNRRWNRDRYNLNDPDEREIYTRETGRDPDSGDYIGNGRVDRDQARANDNQVWGEDPYPLIDERDDGVNPSSLERGVLPPPREASRNNGIINVPAGSQDSGAPTAINPPVSSKASEEMTKLQVLLDRAGASPGVIDGHDGGNVRKALLAYEELTGETLPIGNNAALDAALEASGGPAFMNYEITSEDVAMPMVASIPGDYSEKAKLDHLSFTSVTEALGERFHMDERYLIALNPEANFNRPGTIIRVTSIGKNVTTKVERIVADKGRKQVRAYDAKGNLVVAYPTTIGSAGTPSPTGTHMVTRIALDPEYTYNPKINFKQGENDKILRIPPGPNGPVGTVWIALDKPTYGIHGTPDPSKIGKTESHGCVRLTNWDARELAHLVKAGVIVQFIE